MPLSASLLIVTFLLYLLLFFAPPIAEASSGGKAGQLEVVEGGEVRIPCSITPPPTSPSSAHRSSRIGTVNLVLWYKGDDKTSIYSYDGRDPHNPKHWSNIKGSSQISFSLPPTPAPQDRPHLAFLELSNVQSSDEGLYSCRVDYYRARATETKTQLIVLVPPSQPFLEVWEGGRWRTPAQETSTTQVEIGAHLTLRCTVRGGHPLPEVTWWRGGEHLLGSVEETEGVVRSVVEVMVESTDAHTPLVCQAANTPLVTPLRTPLHLLVLLSPSWVRIEGAKKPMSAGMTYAVECRSKGARPPPVLTWSVGGETQVHASSQTDSEGKTVSRLWYTPNASHAGSLLTCTAHPPEHAAHNTPTSWMKSDSVLLNIMYKPKVELNFQPLETSPDEKQRRPPPFSPSSSSSSSSSKHVEKGDSRITAKKGEENFSTIRSQEDGRQEVNGSEVGAESNTRREEEEETVAENGNEKEEEEEEEEEGMYSLSEGAGGVLQCHVRANPPAFRVSWHRDGTPLSLETDSSEDMVMGNMSIVVQKATPEDAGDYTCTAHNSEGSSRSNPIKLRVNHGPTCKRSTPLVLGVPRHHSLNVTCQVSSFPSPSGFSWALRTYLGRLQVPQDRINWQGTTSWIIYTPRATEDYGELICWAHTRKGRRQKAPCVARLVPADTPDAPERCRVSRRTPSSLTVSCIAAHDGGLPQTFHAWVSFEGRHVNNASSATSEVTVPGLQPATAYSLILWSANTYGNSMRVKLQASTTPSNVTVSTSSSMNGHSTKDTTKEGPFDSLYPSLVAVVAVVTVVGIVVGVVAGLLSRHITVPVRHSADQDDDDDYHAAPPPSPGRRLKVHLRRSGKGNGSLTKQIRKPTARYEFLGTAPRREPHVYDDPVPLRREKKDKVYEELRTTPETECSTLSATSSDPPGTLIPPQFLQWPLPYCRLLRNNDFKDAPRKPVRVDPPKLPDMSVCASQSSPVTSTPLTNSVPRPDFRLILVPETSKILKNATEQDTRLKQHFIKDISSPFTSSKSKFPAITEEEEIKPSATKTKDASCTLRDPSNLTKNNKGVSIEEELSGDQSKRRALIPKAMDQDVNTKQLSRLLHPPGATVRLNTVNSMKITSWDHHKVKAVQEKNIKVDESIVLLTQRGSQPKVEDVADDITCIPATNTSKPFLHNVDTTTTDNCSAFTQKEAEHQVAKVACQEEKFTPDINTETENAATSFPLLLDHGGDEASKHNSAQRDKTSYVSLTDKLHPATKQNSSSSNSSNRLHQHHPYNTSLASIKRSYRSPISAQLATILDPMIIPAEGSVTPRLSSAGQRKPRIGLTSLFSLTASSSSNSSSSSSSFSSSSSSSSSYKRGFRRSARRTDLASPFWRPRSVPTTSGLQMTSHCYFQTPNASSSSSSSPPSPRSSSSFSGASSSSSSCFPYSSTASSSPLSSFYSSENSLPISTSLSQSFSSFQFPTSSSSFSSSATSSSSSSSSSTSSSSAVTKSPFSSFLSPSLTSHSASSFLSLSSCSTSPESGFSGQITPT